MDRVPGYEPGGREFESLRARQMTKGPLAGPFFICRVVEEDEDCCSKKRGSVLDAAGAPQGRGSAQADPSQSRRARQISRGYVCSPFFFSGDTDFIRILELLMDPNPGRAMRIICKSRLSRFRWSRDVRSQPKRSLKSVDWTISARPLTARSGHRKPRREDGACVDGLCRS